MKNRKIIALLCIMAMLMTTLSSLFVVTAASAPVLALDLADDGTVTVGYSGFEAGVSLGTIEFAVPIPEGVEIDTASITKTVGTVNYDEDTDAIYFVFSKGDPDEQLKDVSKDLFTFKVTKKASAQFEITDAYIIDNASGLSGTRYDTENNNLNFDLAEIPEEQGERPGIIMTATDNKNGTYTVSVSYDISKVNITSPSLGTIEFNIPMTVVPTNITKTAGTVNYDEDTNALYFVFSKGDPDEQLKDVSKVLFTFDVEVSGSLSLKPVLESFIDYSSNISGTKYTDVYTTSLKLPLKEDTTATPTPDANKTPDPNETDAPDKTPAPTEEPKPITIPDTAVVATTAPMVGSTGGASTKSYSIKLGDFKFDPADPAIKDVKNVIVSMQGLKNDGTAVGFVFIEVPIDDLKEGSGKVFNGGVPGADKVSVNVYDAANPKNVLNNSKITK